MTEKDNNSHLTDEQALEHIAELIDYFSSNREYASPDGHRYSAMQQAMRNDAESLMIYLASLLAGDDMEQTRHLLERFGLEHLLGDDSGGIE